MAQPQILKRKEKEVDLLTMTKYCYFDPWFMIWMVKIQGILFSEVGMYGEGIFHHDLDGQERYPSTIQGILFSEVGMYGEGIFHHDLDGQHPRYPIFGSRNVRRRNFSP